MHKRISRMSTAAVAVCLLAGAVGLGAPLQARADGTSFALYNLQTKNCLDVKTWSTAPGAIIQQYHCAYTTNQLWAADVVDYHDPDGGEIMVLRSVNSGLCLDLATKSYAPGIGLIQATCDGGPTQRWRVDPPWASSSIGGGGSVATVVTWRRIYNEYSGLCIENQAIGGDRATVQQNTCSTNSNQKFRVPLY